MCQDSLYTKDASFRAPLAEISLRVDSDQDYLGSLLRQDGLFRYGTIGHSIISWEKASTDIISTDIIVQFSRMGSIKKWIRLKGVVEVKHMVWSLFFFFFFCRDVRELAQISLLSTDNRVKDNKVYSSKERLSLHSFQFLNNGMKLGPSDHCMECIIWKKLCKSIPDTVTCIKCMTRLFSWWKSGT